MSDDRDYGCGYDFSRDFPALKAAATAGGVGCRGAADAGAGATAARRAGACRGATADTGSRRGAAAGSLPPLAYLDNAATTHKPTAVIGAVEDYYRDCNANPYRGVYRTSVISTRLYETSRSIVADFIGAQAEEIVFTRNTTEAINLIAYSYALEHLKPGDEIALPFSEHHSNLVVWQQVCAKTGASLVYLHLDEVGRLPVEEIETKIGSATRLVAIAHVSNVLGTVYPVASIAARAHAVGAVVMLDCAQSAGHLPLNVKALDVDFAAFSGHKMYGPLGIGVLYARAGLLESMPPFLFGGEMIDTVGEFHSTFETGPKRFEAGTPNVAGAIGLAAAIDYIATIGFDAIAAIERDLTARLLDGMRAIDAVRIYGNSWAASDRCGIVAFNVSGANAQDVALVLDAQNIAVRSGAHCAQPLHRRLGIEMSCRVSPCFYNTPDEIDRFLNALEGARRAISRRIMSLFP